MSQQSGHFLASPYGGAFAVGNDDSDVWGGLTGTEVGEAFGVGGLGLVGTGRGGGGTGEGTIGLGNTGLIGKGGGGGTGSGYGRGSGAGFGGRGSRVPQVRQAKAQVQGALDKDIIRRIVRAHINEVRHCYNQGLAKDPNLKGRVAVQFSIGGGGNVVSAAVADSSIKDAGVGNCIAQAVRRWKFPKPQGGGSVIVTYPFVLEPG
ncbi:MAG: TonB family protein [Myxococcales bacterium]|nr:TonB family protein [Myxococcales bacterium]